MSKKIYLIDGNSFIYRMFFALPEFSTSDGKPVNATFGMAKFFVGQLKKENPDYVVFIKDAKGKNFRHDIYEQYKATRERMPDNLRDQIEDIEEMIRRMNIYIVSIPGYEADDAIATLAVELGEKSQNEIYILSGDKDLYALVTEQVKIYDTQRKKISGPDETFEKFGVPASCVRDYLAICGDTSDNIPGIAGIGPKKAQVLLNEFGSLEKIYSVIDTIAASSPLEKGRVVKDGVEEISEESQKLLKGKTLEKFVDGKDSAFLSQRLATLETKVDMGDFDLENYVFYRNEIETPELIEFFKKREFYSLITEVLGEKKRWEDIGKNVVIVGDTEGLEELREKIKSHNEIVLDTETTSLNPREADITGVSLLLDEDHIYYINHLHRGPKIERGILQKFLTDILQSDITIVGHNLKYDLQVIETFLTGESSQNQGQEGPDLGQMTLGL